MYKFYANNPNGNLQAEDCVIRAICKVTGEDWYTVYNSYYSGDAKSDFMADVESLMNRAPDEHTRMKFERMLNDMR